MDNNKTARFKNAIFFVSKKTTSFFKRKERMPVADASQFTQMKKFQSVQRRVPGNSNKIYTHLYQPIPTASGLTNFLPSIVNADPRISLRTYVPINQVTGVQYKPRIPSRGI